MCVCVFVDEIPYCGADTECKGGDDVPLLFSGMGREVEHLIHENTQLLETKSVLIKITEDFPALKML